LVPAMHFCESFWCKFLG